MANLMSTSNLLVKTVTWSDGTEQVIIDKDGFVILDGVRARRVGFVTGDFCEGADLVSFHTMLDYLQGKGVRIISPTFKYHGLNLESHYGDTLDLLYSHKMLVIPVLTNKWTDNFGDLNTINFLMDGNLETLSQFLPKWVNKMISYGNVISIFSENEPEEGPGTYTVSNWVNYQRLVNQNISALTNLPLMVKYSAQLIGGLHDALDIACFPFTAIPCADYYQSSAANFTSKCNDFRAFYAPYKGTMQMWLSECGAPNTTAVATSMTKAMVDAILAANTSVVMLYAAWVKSAEDMSFFNTDGTAKANTLAADANFATYMNTWQAAI